MQNKASSPLHGLRVIELGHIAAGPFAGSLLADLGADVVKVERPEGDTLREWPPLTTNSTGEAYSECFASVNRNKRSITADLRNEQDLSMLKELCSKADVIIENYRPGVLKRFGLDSKSMTAVNDQLIYCSVSGYGQRGPNAEKGAFDVTVQAFSGLMSVTGEPGGAPVKCGVPVGDFCAGLYAAYTILAALRRREHLQVGAIIDCSMAACLLGISALQTSEYFGTGRAPVKLGSAHPRNAPYQAFETNDGHVVLAAGNDELFGRTCDALHVPQLSKDPRFASISLRARNQAALVHAIAPILRKDSVAHWLHVLDAHGVPCAPINSFGAALADDQIKEYGLVLELPLPNGCLTKTTAYPVELSGYEFTVFRPPPALGEHNGSVQDEWRQTASALLETGSDSIARSANSRRQAL